MNWDYYTWNESDGHLYDEDGNLDVFNVHGKPIVFGSADEAQDYLESEDICGTVR